jgi:DNA polymerase elongation subunit (family B)
MAQQLWNRCNKSTIDKTNNHNELQFQAISWYANDYVSDADDHDILEDPHKYLIKVFGMTSDHRTISVSILGFTPYFWIRLEDRWGSREEEAIKRFIYEKLERKCLCKNNKCQCNAVSYTSHISSIRVLQKKDFWGFTNFRNFRFMRFSFTSHVAMRKAQNAFLYTSKFPTIGFYKFKLYESNIEPYIRFLHIRDIEPSGWISLPSASYQSTDILNSTCQLDLEVHWSKVNPCQNDASAKFLIASFDIECMSETGDFPVAKKDYIRLSIDVYELYERLQRHDEISNARHVYIIQSALLKAFGILSKCEDQEQQYIDSLHALEPKTCISQTSDTIIKFIQNSIDDIIVIMKNETFKREEKINKLNKLFNNSIPINLGEQSTQISLPSLHGDRIIQIGTTFHFYGERDIVYRHIVTLNTCTDIVDADVKACSSEQELLLEWCKVVQRTNPDIMTGYNIFGFDMLYMYTRAQELDIKDEFLKIGRFNGKVCEFQVKKLSSSALGDNILNFVDMDGRVLIDMMKVVQRDHKLDSYKLDNVASHFLKQNKNDVSPNDIFRLQKGDADDRSTIAKYCLQDCSLCNFLMMRLEIIANNMGMSNVCFVPLSYIFMRGQGVKIFSLVLKQCKDDGFVIPVVRPNNEMNEEEDSFEGAIVLEPNTGIYLDKPVTVLDYASLYPASMISENLSHDCIVIDQKYNNLPGVEYLDISYDIYEGKGDKKKMSGNTTCRFVQLPNGEKGIIPRILMKLLKARKTTRKKLEWQVIKTCDGKEIKGFLNEDETSYDIQGVMELDGQTFNIPKDQVVSVGAYFSEFQKAVLDGLQLAYKVTANSLYGQIGARTSPIYLKEIAACTTATGRAMILKAKQFIEDNYEGAYIVYGDSIASYTPVVYKYEDVIRIDTVEYIAYTFGTTWLPCFDHGKQDKEACELPGLQIWTDNGWVQANRLIRHELASHKTMLRVITQSGIIDVTDDHSLIRANGNIVKPNELSASDDLLQYPLPAFTRDSAMFDVNEAQILGYFMGAGYVNGMEWCLNTSGSTLPAYKALCETVYTEITFKELSNQLVPFSEDIHSFISFYHSFCYSCGSKIVPNTILSSSVEIRQAFWNGYKDTLIKQNLLQVDSQITAATLYILLTSLGMHVSMTSASQSIYKLYIGKDVVSKLGIISTYAVPYNGYVYDFTTSNNKFSAGIGCIIAHNTDSVFVQFNTIDENGQQLHGLEAREKAWQLAEQASKQFKKTLKQPHDLEVDKIFHPFILLSKKRYVGNKYEGNMNKFKQTSMGIVLKRRDNANIVKKVYGGIIDIILNKQDIQCSMKFLNEQLEDLINGKSPIEELIITKSLKANYKDPTRIAHKVLCERIGERDPGNKPQVNDRIPYVYVEQPPPPQGIPKSKYKILQGDRIEHPDFIRKNELRPDYAFYITNQIMKPVLQIYAIIADQLGLRTKEEYGAIYDTFVQDYEGNLEKAKDKLDSTKEKDVKKLLFDTHLEKIEYMKQPTTDITIITKKSKKKPVQVTDKEGIPLPIDHNIRLETKAKRKPVQKKLLKEVIIPVVQDSEGNCLPDDIVPTLRKIVRKKRINTDSEIKIIKRKANNQVTILEEEK